MAPIRVAIVNDYEIVVAGVAAMLAPHHERINVVELNAGLPVMSDVDVVLYDTFGQVQGDAVDLEDLVKGRGFRVVIFSWNTQPELVERAIARGAAELPLEGDERRRDRRRARGDPRRRDDHAAAGSRCRPGARTARGPAPSTA